MPTIYGDNLVHNMGNLETNKHSMNRDYELPIS